MTQNRYSSVAQTMAFFAGITYAVMAVYLTGWWLDAWIGDLNIMMLLMTVITFIYWVAERWYFLPQRRRAAEAIKHQLQKENEEKQKLGIAVAETPSNDERIHQALNQPWWLDWTAGLFPVIVIVFFLRSFVYEPFKIPSGSMYPTLEVGDFILVNKFHYGIRLPITNTKIVENHTIKRGDPLVFQYPLNTKINYIKRVVGLPGDEVSYLNKKVAINGKAILTETMPDYYNEDSLRYSQQFREYLGEIPNRVLNDKAFPAYISSPMSHNAAEYCRYSAEGVVCKVPQGHYFVLGDNRDNSQDSRYWGFVPEDNVVGKPVMIWMHFGKLSRIGALY